MLSRMACTASGVERSMSVSSMRRMNTPPCLRAKAHGYNADRILPRWRKPVGLGAKRVRISDIRYQGSNFQRKSSVVGVAGLTGSCAIVIGPGVCPCGQNRATRRASASFAFTGNVS